MIPSTVTRTSLDLNASPFAGRRLAVVVSRFPKLTETFVLHEVLELRRLGISVEIFPLMRQRETVVQPEAAGLHDAVHYRSAFSVRLWRDNLGCWARDPIRIARTLLKVVRASWRSPRYFAGALLFFPKAVSFAHAAQRFGVEHVHANFANHPAVAAMVIKELTGIPFSFSARGSDVHVDKTMLPEKVGAAEFVVTVSAHMRDEIVLGCGAASADSVHVVFDGIDTDKFAPPPQRGDEDRFRIVCVGRFEEVKGHAQLIDACAILDREGVDFSCHFLGDGELRPSLERRIRRLDLGHRVILHGNCAQPQVVEAIRSSSVCVLATVRAANGKQEGIPNVLKEAMSCGVPVVSSQISGIPELVDDEVSGILVPPRDPIELAKALMRLFKDPGLRVAMGNAGRARIERDFEIRANVFRRAKLIFGAKRSVVRHGAVGRE